MLVLVSLVFVGPTSSAKKFDWDNPPKPKEYLPPKPVIVAPLLVRQKHRKTKMHVYRGGPLTPSFNQLNPMTGGFSAFQPPPSTSALPIKFSRKLSANPQIFFTTTQVEVPALTNQYKANIEQNTPLKISEDAKQIVQKNADNQRNSLYDVLVTRIGTLNQDIQKTKEAIENVNGQISTVFEDLSAKFSKVLNEYPLKNLDDVI